MQETQETWVHFLGQEDPLEKRTATHSSILAWTIAWCFWTVVLKKSLESPLDCKEIQPVHPKGDQSWVFIGGTDVEAETLLLWPPDAESWPIWKDPDTGKDWGQEEKGTTEDEMIGWHHQLYGHGFGWTLGVGDGQGGMVCCSSWGCKESDTTATELNWTEYSIVYMYHSFLIHSSADGHLGCFHVLAIINSAAWILGYTCLFQFWFPQCVCPESI